MKELDPENAAFPRPIFRSVRDVSNWVSESPINAIALKNLTLDAAENGYRYEYFLSREVDDIQRQAIDKQNRRTRKRHAKEKVQSDLDAARQSREQIATQLLERQTEAAERQANEAVKANRTAKLALFVSLIALIASIL